jgi:glycosyltransferase involved in cell wall biosynthesis
MQFPTLKNLPPPPIGRIGWPWTDEGLHASKIMSNGCAWPKISIVTPSFNQGEYIEETIRSVLLQGYENLEYIIMDGGSSDESLAVIGKYEKWISYWISEKDGGQSEAIRRGFLRASGDIFAYINSDDVYTPGTFFEVAKVFDKKLQNDLIVSFSGVEFNEIENIATTFPSEKQRLTEWLNGPTSLFQPSVFWSSHLYRKVGGFDPGMRFCFDKDFFLRCIFDGGRYISEPNWVASKFRVHGLSKTSLMQNICLDENRYISGKYSAIKKYKKILKKELNDSVSREKIIDALAFDDFWKSVVILFQVLALKPIWIFNRFYLGAFRKIISKKLLIFFRG